MSAKHAHDENKQVAIIDDPPPDRLAFVCVCVRMVFQPGKKRALDDSNHGIPASLVMAIRSRVPQTQTSADDVKESYLRFKGDMKMV